MMNKIGYLGFYVGDEYFSVYSRQDVNPQVAAFKLESRLIESLGVNNVEVDVIGSIAVTTYPGNKNLFLPAKEVSERGQSIKIMPIINLPGVKMLSRLLASTYNVLRLSACRSLLVYSTHTPYLIAACTYSFFFKKPFYVFVPDLPQYMNMSVNRSWLVKKLKHLDAKIIDYVVGRSSGLFVTSAYMVKDNESWADLPYMVVDGICESQKRSITLNSELLDEAKTKKIVLYAGGLSSAYGIKELVEGHLKSNTEFELWICGRGELEQYLQNLSQSVSNIRYLGFLSPEEVRCLQLLSKVLVITRNPEELYTRYSFPSKLLEYLSCGVPVLTTKLLGISNVYYEFVNTIDEYSVEGISAALEMMYFGDEEEYRKKAALGQAYVLDKKSVSVIGCEIVNFMERNK